MTVRARAQSTGKRFSSGNAHRVYKYLSTKTMIAIRGWFVVGGATVRMLGRCWMTFGDEHTNRIFKVRRKTMFCLVGRVFLERSTIDFNLRNIWQFNEGTS